MKTLEELIKDQEAKLENCEKAIAAWKQVTTFPRKKDGSPFKILAHNVAGDRVRFVGGDYGWEMSVGYYTESMGYMRDYIYWPDNTAPSAEIVAGRLNQLKMRAEEYRNDIANMTEAYNTCLHLLADVARASKSMLSQYGSSDLLFAIRDELPFPWLTENF